MGRANLSYFIHDKSLVVFSDLLVNIDAFTSEFKNDKELYQNVPNGRRLDDFVYENKQKGRFKIVYADRENVTRVVPVLYDEEPIMIDDDPTNGIVSESEKARRKLLNSKEQLYSKIFLLNKDVDNAKKLSIEISPDEYKLLKKLGVDAYTMNKGYFVSLEDLFRYRAENPKLGAIRPLYEEALSLWKDKMDKLPYDDIYFLSREYRVIDSICNKIRENGISVSNLRIVKENAPLIKGRVTVSTSTPYLLNNKSAKKKKLLVA